MRRLVSLSAAFLVLVGIILTGALLYYATFTESGLRTLVGNIPKRIGRAQIDIVNVSGTLARGLHIERLEVDHERVHLRLDDVKGRVMLPALLWQTIHSQDISVREMLVEVRRRKTPIKPYTPRFLPLGLSIRVDNLRVESGTLIVPSGRRYEASDIQGSGVVRHKTIRVFDAGLTTNGMHALGTAELRAASPMQLTADVRISRKVEDQPAWIINASAEGDLDRLPLRVQLTSPFRADFTGEAIDLTGGWRWSGTARVHHLDPTVWGGGKPLGIITGELTLTGDSQGFTARGPLTPSGLGVGAIQTSFTGSYANRMVFAQRLELTHEPSKAVVTASGAIGLAEGGPYLDLQGRWRQFRWPLTGADAAFHSASGRYSLSGVWPYELRVVGELAPASLASMPVELKGQLAKERLIIREARVEAFDGQAQLAGEIGWAPEERWSVSGTATRIDPAGLRSDLPGKLDFNFTAAGDGFGREASFTATVRDIRGRLRGMPASGSGKLARLGGSLWQFDEVRLALGRTDLALDGRIDRQLDLRFAIDSEDLSLLAPSSRGRLQARGTIHGTAKEPALDFTVRGSGIQHEGITLGSLDARVNFDAQRQRPSQVDIRARDFTFRNRKIDRLTFTLSGTAADHVVDLDMSGAGMKISSNASGAFVSGVWRGTLREVNVNGTESLRLALESPVALEISGERVLLERLCLQGTPVRLCGDADWTPQRWAANIETRDLPMTTLTSGLTPDVEYRGRINATLSLFGSEGSPVQGRLRADLANAQIAHRRAGGRVQVTTLGSGLVTVDATEDSIDAELGLDAGEVGTISGQLRIGRTADRWQDMPLRGRFNARTAELGFITIYAPQVDRAAGRMVAGLRLAGTLGAPLVAGGVKLMDAELDFYQINLAMRGLSLGARLRDNSLEFEGATRIGAGSAKVEGRFEWHDALPYGKLHLTGENLRVVDVPEARIDASPNLDFNVAGRKIEVTGAVMVPYAHIEPADLTSAVRVSSDEIVVGEQEASPSQRFQVVSQITLTLGDRVTIDTFGLTGRLAGSLTLRSGGADEITRGTGELGVTEGRYAAYGRLLDIQRGRLIFSGGPIENPGVDIRAVRQFPDVLAGINVRGTLQQPRMTFFSEPSLPQSQIVSLILAGGAIGPVQNGQNGTTGAGTELLAQGGAILAQQIGSRIGIEDVGIESNLDNETAIVLGKYLSPRLYVSYGISLTESLNTLKLRYTLGDRWTIKTEVGEERSADLVYTIEK